MFKLRKLLRNIRNIFTHELERELSDLAIDYFRIADELEEEKENLLLRIDSDSPIRSRERYS